MGVIYFYQIFDICFFRRPFDFTFNDCPFFLASSVFKAGFSFYVLLPHFHFYLVLNFMVWPFFLL